ncbi:MAG: hypothetical protein DRG33_06775, partial [Deltaproteobacteria bacterium]
MKKWLISVLILPLLLTPASEAIRIEVSVGEALTFTLADLPENSTVTWYTEDGRSHTGKILERPRDLTGLRRVTAVVALPGGGMNTTTFRYYTTSSSYQVYSVDDRSFTALSILNLSGGVANVMQVEGRGAVSTKTVSLSGIEVRVTPPPTSHRSLLFFQLKGELKDVNEMVVAWEGVPIKGKEIGHVLDENVDEACFSLRPKEGYLIVSLNMTDPGILKIDWGGYNPERGIPGDEGSEGGWG